MRARPAFRLSAFLPALSAALALALTAPAARADVSITIDKGAQRMSVAVDGTPRYSWPVSTGVGSYDTPSGSFKPFRMERTHFSKEWDDAPMPYAMFFTNQGHAIHGTNHVRSLGRPASHGCVRLSVRNAATLFGLVKSQGMGRTRVVIEGEGVPVAEGGRRSRSVAGRGPASYDDDQMGTRAVTYVARPQPRYYEVPVGPRGCEIPSGPRGYGLGPLDDPDF